MQLKQLITPKVFLHLDRIHAVNCISFIYIAILWNTRILSIPGRLQTIATNVKHAQSQLDSNLSIHLTSSYDLIMHMMFSIVLI